MLNKMSCLDAHTGDSFSFYISLHSPPPSMAPLAESCFDKTSAECFNLFPTIICKVFMATFLQKRALPSSTFCPFCYNCEWLLSGREKLNHGYHLASTHSAVLCYIINIFHSNTRKKKPCFSSFYSGELSLREFRLGQSPLISLVRGFVSTKNGKRAITSALVRVLGTDIWEVKLVSIFQEFE